MAFPLPKLLPRIEELLQEVQWLDGLILITDSERACFVSFSQVDPLLRRLVVPAAASVGLREEYAYLEKSLERFPAGPEQERLARQAGFAGASHRSLVAGQMGVLSLRA